MNLKYFVQNRNQKKKSPHRQKKKSSEQLEDWFITIYKFM